MTQWVDALKEGIPDYAKDARLNIDAVIKRSTLEPVVAEACALAAAFASSSALLQLYPFRIGTYHSPLTYKQEAQLLD